MPKEVVPCSGRRPLARGSARRGFSANGRTTSREPPKKPITTTTIPSATRARTTSMTRKKRVAQENPMPPTATGPRMDEFSAAAMASHSKEPHEHFPTSQYQQQSSREDVFAYASRHRPAPSTPSPRRRYQMVGASSSSAMPPTMPSPSAARLQTFEQMVLHMAALNRELELELLETRRELALYKQAARRDSNGGGAHTPLGTARAPNTREECRPNTQTSHVAHSRAPRQEPARNVLEAVEALQHAMQLRPNHSNPNAAQPHEGPSQRTPRASSHRRSPQPRQLYQTRGRRPSSASSERAVGRGAACAQRGASNSARPTRPAASAEPLTKRPDKTRNGRKPSAERQPRAGEEETEREEKKEPATAGGEELAELQRRYWEQSREVLRQLDRMLADE